MNKIQNYLEIGRTGSVIFCGIDQKDQLIFDIITPKNKVDQWIYHCGKTFKIDHLRDLEQKHTKVGIILIDSGECTIGLLEGPNYKVLSHCLSDIQSKHSKGGQSAKRFEKIIMEQTRKYLKGMAVKSSEIMREVDFILLGYHITTEKFVDFLSKPMKEKIFSSYTVQNHEEAGLREILYKAQSDLSDLEYFEEKEELEEFFMHLSLNDGLVVYGSDVEKYQSLQMVEKVILPLGDYPEAQNFRKVFQIGAILYFNPTSSEIN